MYHLTYAAFSCRYLATLGLPGDVVVKNLPANAGDTGLILGLGRSPGGGNATHSSILAWRVPWTEEPAFINLLKKKENTVITCECQ